MSSASGTPLPASSETNSNRMQRIITLDPIATTPAGSPASSTSPAADPNEVDDRLPNAIDSGNLNSPATLSQLRAWCDTSNESLTFIINDYLGWPADERTNILRFLQGIGRSYQIQQATGQRQFIDAFEFVLSQMVGDSNVARCEEGRRAALQAAAILHPDALQPAANRIAGRLRALGLRNVSARTVLAEARQVLQNLPDEAPHEAPVRVLGIRPDAPVAPEAVFPNGYGVTLAGVIHLNRLILAVAMFTIARLVGVDGTESLLLAFYRDGRWQRREVPRSQVVSNNSIRSLASLGIPVNAEVRRYLTAYEEANQLTIPVARTTHRLGWNDPDNPTAFLWGRYWLQAGSHTMLTNLDRQPPHTWSNDALLFRDLEAGDRQIVDAMDQRGSFGAWRDAIAAIAPYPRLRFALYAGLASSLLTILGAPSFVIEFCGSTSQGKSTALFLAASPWGCPEQDRGNTLVPTWDCTAAFRERLSSLLANLPVFIDEGSLRDHDKDAVKTVYSIASGRGRGRGLGRGLGPTGTWKTVAITSGETSIVSSSRRGGLRARIFTLWGSPFNGTSAELAQTARRLVTSLHENYGFAGPILITHLLENRDQWDQWRRLYQEYLLQYEQRAGDNPVICRMAQALAAVTVTAYIAHQAMQLPWTFSDPVVPLWDVLTGDGLDADQSVAALEHVLDWARGHQHSFFGRGRSNESQPLGGWAGRWDPDGDFIGFRAERLDVVLRAGGFNSTATIRGWGERGWLLRDNSSGKFRHRVRLGEELAWVVAITAETIRAVEGGADAADRQADAVRLAEVG